LLLAAGVARLDLPPATVAALLCAASAHPAAASSRGVQRHPFDSSEACATPAAASSNTWGAAGFNQLCNAAQYNRHAVAAADVAVNTQPLATWQAGNAASKAVAASLFPLWLLRQFVRGCARLWQQLTIVEQNVEQAQPPESLAPMRPARRGNEAGGGGKEASRTAVWTCSPARRRNRARQGAHSRAAGCTHCRCGPSPRAAALLFLAWPGRAVPAAQPATGGNPTSSSSSLPANG
jgi:hypothetical protein